MNIPLLNMPDDPSKLPGWLEDQMLNGDVVTLAIELSAIATVPPDNRETLNGVLGATKSDVLNSGLQRLSSHCLRLLLRQPELLIELAELVLVDGGSYWQRRIAEHEELKESAQRIWTGVQHEIDSRDTSLNVVDTKWWNQHPFGIAAVSSMMTLVLVLGLVWLASIKKTTPPDSPAWGWQKSSAIPSDATRQEYLYAIADRAEQWFNKRPANPQPLAQRIAELRAGCSIIILSEHAPLPEADRQWLRERCQAWANKIDAHLADIEAGQPTGKVRKEVDATVRALVDAIRKRSET